MTKTHQASAGKEVVRRGLRDVLRTLTMLRDTVRKSRWKLGGRPAARSLDEAMDRIRDARFLLGIAPTRAGRRERRRRLAMWAGFGSRAK